MASWVEGQTGNRSSHIMSGVLLLNITELKHSNFQVLPAGHDEVASGRDGQSIDVPIMSREAVLDVEGLVVPDFQKSIPAHRSKEVSGNTALAGGRNISDFGNPVLMVVVLHGVSAFSSHIPQLDGFVGSTGENVSTIVGDSTGQNFLLVSFLSKPSCSLSGSQIPQSHLLIPRSRQQVIVIIGKGKITHKVRMTSQALNRLSELLQLGGFRIEFPDENSFISGTRDQHLSVFIFSLRVTSFNSCHPITVTLQVSNFFCCDFAFNLSHQIFIWIQLIYQNIKYICFSAYSFFLYIIPIQHYLLLQYIILMEPERKTKYSMRVIMLMLNLRKEIKAKNMQINEYVQKIYRLNPTYLNQLELQKIIQSTHSHFESLDLYELYLELKGSEPMIKVQKFYQIYSSVDKMYPHQGKNQVRHEDKDKTRQVQKKMLRLGLMKLERYVKENNFQVLFHECDVDGNGKLDKLEFNKLMIATDIKELSDKNVRKVLIKKIFSYYPNQMMSKQDFMSFFKIKPEDIQKIKEEKERQKERQKEKQHQRKAIFQKKPQQGGIKQISFENNPKKIDSPMKKADNPMKKKEMKEPQPIKHTQSQAITEEIIDAGSIFPRAIRLYRLGMPAPTELQYLQKLEGYLEANKKFLDHNNPKSNLGEYLYASEIFNGSYHIFQMAASVLNREKSRIGLAREIEPKDIIQGEVGDCYFLSSIASIISFYPEVVSDKILFSSNQAGYYAIKLFIDGEWRIIQTDSRFPCRYGKPVYAKPHGMQIWVMLLEKCWAKVFGSYESIDSGTPTEGFRAISGAPSEYVSAETQQEHNKLYQQLKEGFEKRHVITASGSKYLSQMSQAEQDKVGLISGHAYSFLKFLKIEGETVVKMRNPWGRKIWQGEWSYESKKWTKQLRDRYNYHFQPDDGSFYIPWNQFIRYFSSFVFCKLNPTYSHTSYRSIIKSDQTKYVRMIVREEGSYNIALYQESKRKNLNNPGYNYSGARIILMKIDEEKWEYIGSINKQAHCIYFQANLKRGIYLVATKVEWENRPEKHCCLTTYGPDKVDFEKEDRTIAPLFEKSLIESYSKKNSGKLKTYERLKIPEATNETSFSIDTGIGFMKVKNPSDRWFSTTVSMNSAKGIEIIKPDTLPFCFDMQPKTEKVIGFFVSYSGYSYESSESMETKY